MGDPRHPQDAGEDRPTGGTVHPLHRHPEPPARAGVAFRDPDPDEDEFAGYTIGAAAATLDALADRPRRAALLRAWADAVESRAGELPQDEIAIVGRVFDEQDVEALGHRSPNGRDHHRDDHRHDA